METTTVPTTRRRAGQAIDDSRDGSDELRILGATLGRRLELVEPPIEAARAGMVEGVVSRRLRRVCRAFVVAEYARRRGFVTEMASKGTKVSDGTGLTGSITAAGPTSPPARSDKATNQASPARSDKATGQAPPARSEQRAGRAHRPPPARSEETTGLVYRFGAWLASHV